MVNICQDNGCEYDINFNQKTNYFLVQAPDPTNAVNNYQTDLAFKERLNFILPIFLGIILFHIFIVFIFIFILVKTFSLVCLVSYPKKHNVVH